MNLSIPDDVLNGIELTEGEALLDFALGLFIDRKVTLGRAALIAGMNQMDFQRELAKRKIPIHYDLADLEADLAAIEAK